MLYILEEFQIGATGSFSHKYKFLSIEEIALSFFYF